MLLKYMGKLKTMSYENFGHCCDAVVLANFLSVFAVSPLLPAPHALTPLCFSLELSLLLIFLQQFVFT